MRITLWLLLAISCGSIYAQGITGTLQGRVTDAETGLPMAQVNVILMKDGQILAAQGTNVQGYFHYDKLYANTFDVAFGVKGRTLEQNSVQGVEVKPGYITTLKVSIGAEAVVSNQLDVQPDPVTNPYAFAIVLPKQPEEDRVVETFPGQYYPIIPEQGFVKTADKPNSNFSASVDQAFYSIVRRMISKGVHPPAGAVRIEEMLQYFDYGYPLPTQNDFAVYSETGRCPWQKDHLLVHIGIQARDVMYEALPAANLVFLMDVSGSMFASDKLPLAKSSMRTLLRFLRPQDRVSIVTYNDDVRVVVEQVPGSDKTTILKSLASLEADGATAGATGLIKAYDIANKYYIKNGNNRVILCSDGDFNVGPSSDDELLALIQRQKKSGVYLSVLGYGMDNLQDGKLALLAQHGNGNYGYISNIEEAKKLLVEELGGTLAVVASDVKLRVAFDENSVEAYRLIGYENRALTDKTYEQRKTDAAEVGAGHSVTALYEVIPVSGKQLDDGWISVELAYKKPGSGKNSPSIVREFEVTSIVRPDAETTATFRFSAAVAAFGMLLRESAYGGETDLALVYNLASSALGEDKSGYRADFIRMLDEYKKLPKK